MIPTLFPRGHGICSLLIGDASALSSTLNWHHMYGVSKHRQFDCLFNRVFKLTANKSSKVRITGPLWGEIHLFSRFPSQHYSNVIMGTMASQITSLTNVYSIVSSGVDQRKHQSSTSLAFVRGIHRWPVNSRHKGPATSGNAKNVSIWWRHHECGKRFHVRGSPNWKVRTTLCGWGGFQWVAIETDLRRRNNESSSIPCTTDSSNFDDLTAFTKTTENNCTGELTRNRINFSIHYSLKFSYQAGTDRKKMCGLSTWFWEMCHVLNF